MRALRGGRVPPESGGIAALEEHKKVRFDIFAPYYPFQGATRILEEFQQLVTLQQIRN